jgi:hypothetical protein
VRILAEADAYDTLISDCLYRRSVTPFEAKEINGMCFDAPAAEATGGNKVSLVPHYTYHGKS